TEQVPPISIHAFRVLKLPHVGILVLVAGLPWGGEPCLVRLSTEIGHSRAWYDVILWSIELFEQYKDIEQVFRNIYIRLLIQDPVRLITTFGLNLDADALCCVNIGC